MPQRSRALIERLVALVGVAGSAVFILLQLQPRLLVTKTLAAGGDMGAHVWGPAFMRDELLSRFRITGWAPAWYAGFPAYHFYFPLPSLLIVALDVVLPYEIAFKVVTVLGLVGLPIAAWAFGRLSDMPFPIPPLFAMATVPFVFDRYHTIWGGNAAATLAGEFSFTISLCLVLVYLGVLNRGLRTGEGRALAAVLLGAAALCHLIPVAFAAAASLVTLAVYRPAWRRVAFVVTTGVVAGLVAAFWLVPFLARLPYSNDMGWERTDGLQAYVNNLIPFLRTDTSAATTSHLKLVIPLAVVGAVVTTIRLRRSGILVALYALVAAAAFVLVPAGPIWNARFLPFWYLGLYLLAALAVGEVAIVIGEFLRPDGDRPHPAPLAVAPVVLAIVTYLIAGIPLGLPPQSLLGGGEKSFVPGWATWNYSGYERKEAYPEYREVISTMADIGREHGCGRAMWEYEQELNRFGTPMALMLLPYWTDGCIGSMEGLYFESSATVPYHFLNQSELSLRPSRAMRDLPYRELDVAKGVEHLQLLGVRYYMAISPEARSQARAHPDLELIATTTPRDVSYTDGAQSREWDVFLVRDSAIVEPLAFEPVVIEEGSRGKEDWLHTAVDWYQDTARWDVPLAVDGPAEWGRVETAATQPPRDEVAPTRVTNIEHDADGIRFDVSRTGTPVLVKISYFPNWNASGADGPWRVTPNLMVVVPTENHVELSYGWTAIDVLGWLLTLGGVAVVVGLARAPAVRFPEPPKKPEVWIDPFAVAPPEPPGQADVVTTVPSTTDGGSVRNE